MPNNGHTRLRAHGEWHPITRLAVARALGWVAACITLQALMFQVYDQSGKATHLSAVALVGVIVGISCGPLAGLLADRWPFKITVLVPAALSVVWTLLYTVIDLADIWQVLPIVVMSGILGSTAAPAVAAATVALADGDQAWAASRTTSFDLVGVIVGTMLGGVLQLAGADTAFLIAAGVAAAAWFAYLLVDKPLTAVRDRRETETGEAAMESEPEGFLRRLARGWTVTRGSSLLTVVLISACILIAGRQFAMMAEVPLVRSLNGTAVAFAVLSTVYSVGGVIGAWAVRRQLSPQTTVKVLLHMRAVQVICIGAVVAVHALWWAVAMYFIAGATGTAAAVAGRTAVAETAPHDTIGRVTALQSTAGGVTGGLALVAAGPIIDATGPDIAFLICMGLGLIACVPLVRRRRASQ